MDRPFQCQHRDIVTVRLRGEFEVRMHVDASNAEGVGGQRFHGRIDHVIAQGHVNLSRSGSGDAVSSSDDVSSRDQ